LRFDFICFGAYVDVTANGGRHLYHLACSPNFLCRLLRARAKITSHFKRRRILPGGVAKARNMLDIPALSRLAMQAPQRLKYVN
jgi:hypothetical protein